MAFGPLVMNSDLDSVVWANHLCNAAGVDTISAGVSIAYAIDLFEKGILSQKKAGMKLAWGDAQTMLKLVEMIINRQGIGKLLGEGTKRMAEALGADPETAANVKGMEMAMHDARAFTGEAISYATGPRGACHLKGDYYMVELGGAFPEIGVFAGDRMQVAGQGGNGGEVPELQRPVRFHADVQVRAADRDHYKRKSQRNYRAGATHRRTCSPPVTAPSI